MKTKDELLKMLYDRLTVLKETNIKSDNPKHAKQLAIELGLLYDILDEDVPHKYWESIEEEI